MLPVLVIDDNAAVRSALSLLFEVHDVPCLTAASPEEGLAVARKQGLGAVIQDMNFSQNSITGEEGVKLFHDLRRIDPSLPILLITAWTSLETAVSLVKEGAQDYMGKPWDDQRLLDSIQTILANRTEQPKADAPQPRASQKQIEGLVYADPKMDALVETALRIAPADVPVLITGPNGSGKEMFAQLIQSHSQRTGKPFITVNAGALPPDLLESELFGVEPGAFTGAQRRRLGRFEEADGGTLFLDEIGNLPHDGQIKLLRVLQSGEFSRLGGNRVLKTDVRVISATNADLPAAIAKGTFREDLYFRLNVVELKLPPLAQRPADILPLALHFLRSFSTAKGKSLNDEARAALQQHDWPGNVRELQNKLQRAGLIATGTEITAADLDLKAGTPIAPKTDDALDPEAQKLEDALDQHGGNVSKAAAALGLSRQAFYRRMEKWGISLERRTRHD